MENIKSYQEFESFNEGLEVKRKLQDLYDYIRDSKYDIVSVFKILVKSIPDVFDAELIEQYDIGTPEGKAGFEKVVKERMDAYTKERKDSRPNHALTRALSRLEAEKSRLEAAVAAKNSRRAEHPPGRPW